MNKNILVISDNSYLLKAFINVVGELAINEQNHVRYVHTIHCENEMFRDVPEVYKNEPIDVKKEYDKIIDEKWDIIFSVHCKQLFPSKLVNSIRCINIHPGYNPYNRGWFPQVFSILNGYPLGATIHLIDEALDHGQIIDQKLINLEFWDTSLTAYNKILEVEIELLRKNILNIISGNIVSKHPMEEGNLNLKNDFNKLCKIDLNQEGTFGQFYDLLRALTHGSFKNAYFIDEASGKKVNISINIEVDEQ